MSDSAHLDQRRAHPAHSGFQGIRYRNNYIPATSSDGAAGQISFSGTYTGYSEADFFLGLPSYMGYGLGFSGTVGQRNERARRIRAGRLARQPALTLNFGIRWQLFTPIYEVHDRMTNFGMYSGQIELAGQNGNSRALYNQYNGIANFLPRLGLAYSLDDKTVLRAAFSRSSFQEGTGEYNRLATNAPWNVDLVGQWGGVGSQWRASPPTRSRSTRASRALGATGGCTVANVTSAPASCFAGRPHARHRSQLPPGGLQRVEPHPPAPAHQHPDAAGRLCRPAQRPPGRHLQHGPESCCCRMATRFPGPYLAGNPTLKNDGTGQQRLNTSTAIQNYDALQMAAQAAARQGA